MALDEVHPPRKLTAILLADVVGYSRLMGEDEAGTLARLDAHRNEFIDPTIESYHGHIVKLMGDGALVEFPSVVEAVTCAVAIQEGMAGRNEGTPESQRIELRIGINLGDVIVKDDDIYGDGVNVAARLEALAEPGGICLSDTVYKSVRGKLDLVFEDLGEQQVKNIAEPVRTYRARLKTGTVVPAPATGPETDKRTPAKRWRPLLVIASVLMITLAAGVVWLQPWESREEPASMERMAFPLPDKPSVAVLPFDNMSGDSSQEYFSDGLELVH